MKVGITGFRKERLGEALTFNLESKSGLAKAIGVPPSSVTKYLSGGSTPSALTFSRMCQVLKFPPSFFLDSQQDDDDFENTPKLWRSLSSAKKLSRLRGTAVMRWQVRLRTYFASFFNLPLLKLPQFDVPADYKEISNELIDNITLKLRSHWEIGGQPVRNMVRLMEKSGIVVSRFDLLAEKLDAVSAWTDGVPYVLLNAGKESSARSRFDAAHELGHIILHKNLAADDYSEESGFHLIEEQAHYFASSLLLPEVQFVNDLWAPTLKCFEDMKAKWNVSIQAMMRRGLGLELMSQNQYNNLNINISKRDWRRREPLDLETPIEKPRLFSQCIEKMERELGLHKSKVLSDTKLPSQILEELISVPQGTFEDDIKADDNVIEFRSNVD